jgi:hypothetical protein
MFSVVSILSLVLFHIIKVSSECESNAILWTYYPCSFIISPTSFDCQHLSVTSSIDQCVNKEMTFFWHFPFGNMTLTLQADNNQSFLLNISQISLSTNRLIKNTYHLVNNKISEERLISNNENEMITLSSDEHNQCSIRFETINSNIYEYGTFIRMSILTDKHKDR